MKTKLMGLILIPAILLLVSCSMNADDDDESTPSESQLPAPTGLTLTDVNVISATITWKSVDGATSYAWQESRTSSFPDEHYSEQKGTTPSLSLSNFIPDAVKYIRVAAISSSNLVGNYSEPISIHFPASNASIIDYPYPDNFHYSVSGVDIYLDWSVVSNASHYYVYESKSGTDYDLCSSWSGPNTGVTLLGLDENTTYYFKIATKFSDGTISQYSPTVLTVTTEEKPASPTYGNFTQVPSSAKSITVDEISGGNNVYNTDHVTTGNYKYYYFRATKGTTYYICWYDKYCKPSQLTTWGYSDKTLLYTACYLAGKTTFDEYYSTSQTSTYGYFSITADQSGYYVVRARGTSTDGYYGIRVCTVLP